MAECSRWDLLADDLLCAIASRLNVLDFTRVLAVCRGWNLVLTRESTRIARPEFPWLLLPSDDGELNSSCSFLSITGPRPRHSFPHVPEISGRRCVGSKDGWLVTLDIIALEPRILNLFTRSELSLPCLPTKVAGDKVKILRRPDHSIYAFWAAFDDGVEFPIREFPDLYLKKIVLSTVPHGVAAVICGVHCDILALASPGDEHWSPGPEPPPWDFFDDLAYCEVDRRFYVLTALATVLAFNADGSAVVRIAGDVGSGASMSNKYIVCFSPGILLVVWRDHDFYDLQNGKGERSFTIGFKIYQVDSRGRENQKNFMPVKDLGDKSLILGGRSSSVSVTTKSLPGLRKGCIYFTEDLPESMYYSGKSISAIPFMDIGWFDVRDRTIGRHFPLLMAHTRCDWPAPIWFLPRL